MLIPLPGLFKESASHSVSKRPISDVNLCQILLLWLVWQTALGKERDLGPKFGTPFTCLD